MISAILRLDGELEQGIRAILTIETEDKHACIEVSGSLPANPNLATTINLWQFNYRSLGSTRILPIKITDDSSINQRRKECQELDRKLRSHLNNWLLAESFRPIRDKWLERLMHDEVRVLIRTPNLPLLKLPWQLWDVLERNSRLEVALSTPDFEPIASAKTPLSNRKNRILAILGDSKGIDLQQDRQLLNNLAFDRFMQLRNQEKQDSRLLIVTVTEEDFQLPEQKLRKGSLSDLALTRLLKKLVPMKPRAIGLDIYRDFPVSSHQKELSNYLSRHDNFFAICKASDRQSGQPGISPPPEVPSERLGFSDIIKDSDGIYAAISSPYNPILPPLARLPTPLLPS